MDKASLIHKRKRRYMAHVLEAFEELLEPLLEDHPEPVGKFKGMVRRKMNALAVDAVEVMSLNGEVENEAARQIKDALQPDGAASR